MTTDTKVKGFHLATGMTPTGVVVSDALPLSEEWFAARRAGITATDIPKILGDSDYGNAISVWLDKRGEWLDEAGEAAEWGTVLEDPIARVWAKRNNTHVAPVEMLGKKGAEWMRASLDRLVRECPLGLTNKSFGCPLEVKTRSAWVAGKWRDDMPDEVLSQVAWQRIVTGVSHVHVACLLGGQRLVEHVYHRDDKLEAFIVAEAERVWQHVQDGTRPLADPNALLAKVLDVIYAKREGALELDADDPQAAEVELHIAAYEDARRAAKEAKRAGEAARALLIQDLGPTDAAYIDGQQALTYRANRNGIRSIGIGPSYRKDPA